MDRLSEKSCIEFSEILASKAPVPGGGGVAALVGALGVALCSMAGNITKERKKYKDYLPDYERTISKGEEIRNNLIELIDEDAKGFEPLQKAYSIPKDDPTREAVMQKASLDACDAPLRMMKNICSAIELLEEMFEKGSPLLLSDVGCGALCTRAAIECASMNIFINAKSMSDEDAKKLVSETEAMLDEYIPRAETVAKKVMKGLRG